MMSWSIRRRVSVAGVLVATVGLTLTLSSGAAYAATADVGPQRIIQGPATLLDGHEIGLAVDSSGNIWESAENGDPRLMEYAPDASGDAAPIRVIHGDDTQLFDPQGITVDSAGDVYVVNNFWNMPAVILEFAPTANGDAAPIRTITFDGIPEDIALDSSGRMWVTNEANDTVEVFAADATDGDSPVQVIGGPSTGLGAVHSLAIDPSGNVWVTNELTPSITEYAPTATGDAAPLATISGSNTDIGEPIQLAFAQDGSLLMIGEDTSGQQALLTFAPGATGNVAPTQELTGPETGFQDAQALTVDSEGNQWVADSTGLFIEEFNVLVNPIDPSVGPTTGGQHVTISGHGFTRNVTVTIGGQPLKDVVVVNSTTITGVTPPHAAGTVPVWVKFPGYTVRSASPYTYVALAETGLDPSTSMVAGATMLVIGVGLFLGFRRRKPRIS